MLLLPVQEPATVMTIGLKALHYCTSAAMTWVGVVPLSKCTNIFHYIL